MKSKKWKPITYGLITALLLSGLKLCEYYFVSFKLDLDIYLAIIALIFLVIGAGAAYTFLKYSVDPAKKRKDNIYSMSGAPEAYLLTGRESEVLHLIALGYSNQQIADELFVSLNTVKTHVKNIYSKLGVQRRTQAVAEAKRLEILD